MRRLSRFVVVTLGTVLFVFVGGDSGLPAPGGGSVRTTAGQIVVVGAPTDVQASGPADLMSGTHDPSAGVQRRRAPSEPPGSSHEEGADMKRSTKIIAGVAFAAAVAGGAGVAAASGGSDDAQEGPDVAITGDALQRATDAALAETGGGRVTGTEVGDEESYYEVEVTLDDGRQVDVQLDEDFAVVGSSADVEDSDEGEG